MSERLENEPKNTYASALAYLLDEHANRPDSIGGFYIAKLLYEACQNPSSDLTNKVIKEAFRDAGELTSDIQTLLISVIDDTIDKGDTSIEEYRNGLAAVIQDVSSPDLSLNANAIRLAYTLKAWEMEGAVRFIELIEAQLNDEEKVGEWFPLIEEKDLFLALMKSEKNSHVGGETGMPSYIHRAFEQGFSSSDTTTPASPQPNYFRDFINTLDILDDDFFTGKKD